MTKYLLIAAIVLLVWFLWRAQKARPSATASPPAGARQAALPQEMVRCQVCALHLPMGDAYQGSSGRLYCSHEHRAVGGN